MRAIILQRRRQTGVIHWLTAGLILAIGFGGLSVEAQTWVPLGPSPNTGGQVENIVNKEVVGAVNSVALHPTDKKIAYIGSVNGGIWKTMDAMSPSPNWQQQTDGQASLSIGALAFDPTDTAHNTLVAGIGRFSSIGDGGALTGILRTVNGGAAWTPLDGGGVLKGLNISGVAPRGKTIVISVGLASSPGKVGLWQSRNAGASWDQLSGGGGSGLPAGAASGLHGDPTDPKRLFTNAGGLGIYQSTNTGATWTKISSAAMDAMLGGANNVKIAVGKNNNIYVAIVRGGQLSGLFRSGNGGVAWSSLDLPVTTENGGTSFGIHPGKQGGIHLALAADLTDANVVYVGGDRQPCFTESDGCRNPTVPAWPNSLGARDYSGRLFRINASKNPGMQVEPLTHKGTMSNTSPHADSRYLAVAVDGSLVHGCDGGIYRRTNPLAVKGDWLSMNGTLQTTEFHAIAWDANARIAIGGAQDTGTPEQKKTNQTTWRSVSTGDGGVVVVDDTSTPGRSTRYSSYFDFFDFRRQVFDANNVLLSEVRPSLLGGENLTPHFYTPIKLNTTAPHRLIIGAANGVYESLDQGDTVAAIKNIPVNDFGRTAIAYGATGNPDMLYVGSGNGVFVRAAAGADLAPSAAYHGGFVVAIAIDPGDPKSAFVVDLLGHVFRTRNAGATWSDISGNLAVLAPGTHRTLVYNTKTKNGAIIVGGDDGVFSAVGPNFTNWAKHGTGLPRAPIYHLDYNRKGNVLIAGTLGRGAWILSAAKPQGDQLPPAKVGGEGGKEMTALAVPLRPGVIVGPGGKHLYLMSPGGTVEAINLETGKEVWASKDAAKPLGVSADHVIGQAEAPADGNAMKVVVLDRKTGKAVTSGSVILPAGVKPSINETIQGRFAARAQTGTKDAVVSWQFVAFPRRGVKPGTPSALPDTDKTAADAPVGGTRGGAVRLDLATGATTSITALDVMPPLPRLFLLPPDQRLKGLPDQQYASVDGRHVLVSAKGEDDAWQRYTLSVYDRDTGNKLGQFKSHLAAVQFYVSDKQVVFETGPYARRIDDQLKEEPLKVRLVDLQTGEERWSRPVRDTAMRGPFPP
jgi:hypothetical protein